MFATNRMGFLRWPWAVLLCMAMLAQAQAQNTPTTPTTPPAGYCAVDVTLTDTLPTKFILTPLVADLVNPFFSTTMTVTLVCSGEVWAERSNPLLLIGIGTTVSPLQGGIAGVSANVTNPAKGTLTCPSNSIGAFIQLNSGQANLSFGRNGNLASSIRTGDVCTVAITATLNYYNNGSAFNSNASSIQSLTDTNPATSFIYKSFVREDTGLTTLSAQLSSTGNQSARPFASVTSTGINAFTVAAPPVKTCVVANAVNKQLDFTLPTLDVKTASLKRNTGAGFTSFAIVLSGCTVAAGANNISGTIAYTAPTGTGVSSSWIQNTAPTSPAQNVYTMLLDASQNVIGNGASIPLTQNGSTKISAQYMSRQGTGVVLTPGKVFGSAILTLSYQ